MRSRRTHARSCRIASSIQGRQVADSARPTAALVRRVAEHRSPVHETDKFDAVGVVLDLQEVKLCLGSKSRLRGRQQWTDLFALGLVLHDL
jgi:hypothetical protein